MEQSWPALAARKNSRLFVHTVCVLMVPCACAFNWNEPKCMTECCMEEFKSDKLHPAGKASWHDGGSFVSTKNVASDDCLAVPAASVQTSAHTPHVRTFTCLVHACGHQGGAR